MAGGLRALLLLCVALISTAVFAAEMADTILVGGKIVTVDDRFTIAQAVAIRGQRIVAVGANADIRKLAGGATKVIELRGRTVIPGLIDNHSHWIRAAEHDELRFDGVTTRKEALALLSARVRAARPGEWIAVLGGWAEQQFTDDPRGFPLDELDRIAPNNPVVIQAVYIHSYLNSAALTAAKIDGTTPDPPNGRIEKDAGGKPTGVVRGAGGVAFVAAKIPLYETGGEWLANTRKLVAELNSMGITAWLDAAAAAWARSITSLPEPRGARRVERRVYWTAIRQPNTRGRWTRSSRRYRS
jgi:predicted amidohydrolase YtcJ